MKTDFGKSLKELRGYMPLRALGEKTGISNSYLCKLEGGVRIPKPETLRRLAPALDVPYEKLMVLAGYIDEDVLKPGVMDGKR